MNTPADSRFHPSRTTPVDAPGAAGAGHRGGRKLRVAFMVQGEGRGHMTQALALATMLRDAGHEVARVFVGHSPHRPIPRYFLDGIQAPVTTFPAPMQVPGTDRRGASVARTAASAMLRLPSFIGGGVRIHLGTRRGEVDVAVNFLDLVTGLSRVILRTRVPSVAIAHNYRFLHAALPRGDSTPGSATGGDSPDRDGLDAVGAGWMPWVFRTFTRASALRSKRILALSYGPEDAPPGSCLHFVPPLLRPEIHVMKPETGPDLLAYALNPGYADVLARWHRGRTAPDLHCFVEGGAKALSDPTHHGFHAHDLDDRAFLRHLAHCRAYIGSAGFESLCEAFYLGKPALAVPTEGQYEQRLNAWDAHRAGAARSGSYADLDAFLDEPPTPDAGAVEAFRAWVARAPEMVLATIEQAAGSARRS